MCRDLATSGLWGCGTGCTKFWRLWRFAWVSSTSTGSGLGSLDKHVIAHLAGGESVVLLIDRSAVADTFICPEKKSVAAHGFNDMLFRRSVNSSEVLQQ